MTEIRTKHCYLIDFPKFGDGVGGYLTFFESSNQIPFKIRRVYYIYDIGDLNTIRGFHAHKATEQVFITLKGKATYVLDDGKNKDKVTLETPNIGIYMGPMVWHTLQNFSPETVILVLASEYYDESDYIQNYKNFKHLVV